MTPARRVLGALEARGLDPRPAGAGKWVARCPAHEDRTPSFAVWDGHARDGTRRAGVHCLAGCDWREVLTALELEPRDLFELDGQAALWMVRSRVALDHARSALREAQAELARMERGTAVRRHPWGPLSLAAELMRGAAARVG